MPPKNAYRCVVRGCKSKDVICHRFPNPRTDILRLKAWMKIVGLENEDPHHVYGNKYICSRHFTSNCTSPGTKRLNANAYPSINLPTVQCVQNSKAGQIDLDSLVMSGIVELDTSLADSNTIGVTSVQTNKTDHIDLDSSVMSGIVELDSSLADSNTIGITSVQTNKTDHIDLDNSVMSGIVELDSSLADPNIIHISVDRDNVDSVKHVWNKTKSKASAKTKSNSWPYTSGFFDGFGLWRIKSSKKSYRVWCSKDSIWRIYNPTDLVRRTKSLALPQTKRPGPTDHGP